MNFEVITESGVSSGLVKPAPNTHFPKRYARYLTPSTRVVYYNGKLKDISFREKRLSDEPHYFVFATIEWEPFKDEGQRARRSLCYNRELHAFQGSGTQ